MSSDYDERAGYEEDHEDRDDYPEEVWEQIQAERRRLEGEDDDDDLSEFTAAPEPKLPSFTDEQLKEMAEDFERMEREKGMQQVEPDRDEPLDPSLNPF
jgi:hypothetical protein